MVRDHGFNMIRTMQLSGFEDVNRAIQQTLLCVRAGVESLVWLLKFTAKLKKLSPIQLFLGRISRANMVNV